MKCLCFLCKKRKIIKCLLLYKEIMKWSSSNRRKAVTNRKSHILENHEQCNCQYLKHKSQVQVKKKQEKQIYIINHKNMKKSKEIKPNMRNGVAIEESTHKLKH